MALAISARDGSRDRFWWINNKAPARRSVRARACVQFCDNGLPCGRPEQFSEWQKRKANQCVRASERELGRQDVTTRFQRAFPGCYRGDIHHCCHLLHTCIVIRCSYCVVTTKAKFILSYLPAVTRLLGLRYNLSPPTSLTPGYLDIETTWRSKK